MTESGTLAQRASRDGRVTAGLFMPDVLLPAQFAAQFRSGQLSPERRLMLAVLEDAVSAFLREGEPHRQARGDAEAWILSGSEGWPLSFNGICEAFDVDPAAATAALFDRRARHGA